VAAARPAERGDMDGVLDLRRAWDLQVHGEPRTTRDFLAAHYPADGHWVADGLGGRLDGYAAVDSGGGLDLWIRPGADIDAALGALVDAAASHHGGPLEAVLPGWEADLCAAFERLGFTRVHEVLEMGIELSGAALEPRWPEGIRLRPFAAERDAPGKHIRMPSGAGHDAQWLARKMPAAMMFVPSMGGISHHWSENTSDEDLVLGAQVFANGIAVGLKT